MFWFFLRKKYISVLKVNLEVIFGVKKLKSSTFTPPILNFIVLPFQNSLVLGLGHTKKN